MKDLIPNDVVALNESEINQAVAKDKQAKAIISSTLATGKAKNTQREKVRISLKKVSLDGKSHAGLHEVELAMNKLKLLAIKTQDKSDMLSLKSCIEKVFIELANDDNFPFHTMENRKSIKDITFKNDQPCIFSPVLNEKGGNKGKETPLPTDIIVNLTADDNNEFYSKNKQFFDLQCEIENGELAVDDKTFNYTMSLFAEMQNELKKMRKNALAKAKKPVEV
jgi:hypothetical protein